jgi:hypothetical protein
MGCDITAYVETLIDGVWTFTGRLVVKRDYVLFERLGWKRSGDGSSGEADLSSWTALTRYDYTQADSDAHCPGCIGVNELRRLAVERFHEEPDTFDTRPGWITDFKEWLAAAVNHLASEGLAVELLEAWDDGELPLGTDLRLCYWFDSPPSED